MRSTERLQTTRRRTDHAPIAEPTVHSPLQSGAPCDGGGAHWRVVWSGAVIPLCAFGCQGAAVVDARWRRRGGSGLEKVARGGHCHAIAA
jgi:hypothetical protein